MRLPTLLRVDVCKVSVLVLALVAIAMPFIFVMGSLPHKFLSRVTVNVLLPQVLVAQRYVPSCVSEQPRFSSAMSLVKQCGLLVMVLLSIAICNFVGLAIDRGYIALEMVFVGKARSLALRFVASLVYATCVAVLSSYVLSAAFSVLTGLSESFSFRILATCMALSALFTTLISFNACIYLKRFSEALVTSILAIISLYALSLVYPSYNPFLSLYIVNPRSEALSTYVASIATLSIALALGVRRFEV